MIYFHKSLFLLLFILLFITGCSKTCSQGDIGKNERTTTLSSYTISYYTTAYIESVRWVNVTTGDSGAGTVTHNVYACFFILGCGTWTSRVEMTVNLAIGLNEIETYRMDDGCEWRDDYLITRN